AAATSALCVSAGNDQSVRPWQLAADGSHATALGHSSAHTDSVEAVATCPRASEHLLVCCCAWLDGARSVHARRLCGGSAGCCCLRVCACSSAAPAGTSACCCTGRAPQICSIPSPLARRRRGKEPQRRPASVRRWI